MQTTAGAAPPQILGQPQNQVVAPGGAASFFVVAGDTRALTYAWQFNGVPLGGSTTNDALLLQNVSTNNEGEYRVVLTNPSGSVTSAPAFLMLDSDADGVGDSWELTYFGNLTNSSTADFDSDGVSNLQEFLDDTNPTNSVSARYRILLFVDGGSAVKSPDQSSYTNGESVTLTATASSNEIFHAWIGDIVTRSNPVTLVMTNNKTVYARFTPIVFTWTNVAGGDWNVATNWTPNLVPGSNDSVVINSGVGFVVTLNTSADCATVTLGSPESSPTLTGSGTLTVLESISWRSGVMSGSGRTVLNPGATFTLDNVAGLSLSTRTLELGGETFWTAAANLLLNNAVITNRAGALFHAFSSGSISLSAGSGRFDNAGIFRKAANSGITAVQSVSFNNYGTVEVQTGTLNLAGLGNTNSGSVALSGGATLNLSAGTHIFTGSSVITGDGQFMIGSGTANFNGNYIFTNNTLTISGGTANFNGTGLVSPAVLNLSGGTLDGSNLVTVLSQMNWAGGTMQGSGRTLIPTTATLNITNGGVVGTRTLENGGTALWTGGNIGLNNGVITNRAGALFHAQTAASLLLLSGSPRFDNAGTFRKSVSSGTTAVSVRFNNSGTVEIQTGTLSLGGGGTHSGSFDVPGGTALGLSGVAHTAGMSSSITGAGHLIFGNGTVTLAGLVNISGSNTFSGISSTVNLIGNYICTNNTLTISGAGGTANFNGTGLVSPAVLDLSNGTLGGSNVLTVLDFMNWTGGTMSGSGRTIIPAGVTLNAAIPSSASLATRTLENGGTILWTGPGLLAVIGGAVITNRAGALFHAQNAAILGGGIANGRFDNGGMFHKSANTGTLTLSSGFNFTNYGTVDLRSGILAANGNYASTSNALLNCALGGTNAGTGYGQLQKSSTITLNGALSVDFTNGFSPALNDSFTVLTAGTRNGTFANFIYPSNVVTMQLSNSPTAVILRVTNVFAAVPAPLLLPPDLIGPDIRLTWTSVSNATYRLEFNPELSDLTNWSALPGDVTATNSTTSKLDALTPSNRVYRVRVLP